MYNELANGVQNLNNAEKITHFNIPFVLTQMIMVMLMFHWFATAFLVALSIESMPIGCIISFVVIFSFWSINYIATELEQPFGDDANDLPLFEMQHDLNASIMMLFEAEAQNPPAFDFQEDTHVKLALTVIDIEKELPRLAQDHTSEVAPELLSTSKAARLAATNDSMVMPKMNRMPISCTPNRSPPPRRGSDNRSNPSTPTRSTQSTALMSNANPGLSPACTSAAVPACQAQPIGIEDVNLLQRAQPAQRRPEACHGSCPPASFAAERYEVSLGMHRGSCTTASSTAECSEVSLGMHRGSCPQAASTGEVSLGKHRGMSQRV